MAKITQDGISFNIEDNFLTGEQSTKIVGKITSGNNPYSDLEEGDTPSKLVNAVEIDWNGANLTYSDGTSTTIDTTGDLLSFIQNQAKGSTGPQGVSVSSVKQTTTSTADGGNNVVTVTLSNGTTSTFNVKNGSKGSKGDKGDKGDSGDSVLSYTIGILAEKPTDTSYTTGISNPYLNIINNKDTNHKELVSSWIKFQGGDGIDVKSAGDVLTITNTLLSRITALESEVSILKSYHDGSTSSSIQFTKPQTKAIWSDNGQDANGLLGTQTITVNSSDGTSSTTTTSTYEVYKDSLKTTLASNTWYTTSGTYYVFGKYNSLTTTNYITIKVVSKSDAQSMGFTFKWTNSNAVETTDDLKNAQVTHTSNTNATSSDILAILQSEPIEATTSLNGGSNYTITSTIKDISYIIAYSLVEKDNSTSSYTYVLGHDEGDEWYKTEGEYYIFGYCTLKSDLTPLFTTNVLKWVVETASTDSNTYYYWYVGQTNPSTMSEITSTVSDTSSPGWRLIGTTIGTYSLESSLYNSIDNKITSSPSSNDYWYVALPSTSSLSIYDSDDVDEVKAGNWTKLSSKTLNNVEYTIYKTVGTYRNFYGFIIH